jgi:hypothetical protein
MRAMQLEASTLTQWFVYGQRAAGFRTYGQRAAGFRTVVMEARH